MASSSRDTPSRFVAYSSSWTVVPGGENVNCCRTISRSPSLVAARTTNSWVRACERSSNTSLIRLIEIGAGQAKRMV
jgi:hypothetical protein